MPNVSKNTPFRFRKPLAFFGAIAAGCLVNSYLPAQETNIAKPVISRLDEVFTSEEKIEFSPVPALNDRLRQSHSPILRAPENKPEPVFNPPVVEGPSAQEFFGELRTPYQVADTSAKMVVPSTPERATAGPAKKASRIPTAENAFKPSMSAPGFSAPSNQSTLSNSQILSQQPANQPEHHTASLASYNQPPQYQQFREPVVAPVQATTSPQSIQQEQARFNRMPLTNRSYSNAQQQRVASLPFNSRVSRSYSGVHKLQTLNISQFETRVLEIWGSRIQTSSSADGRFVRVKLPTLVRDQMSMMVDRQTQSLTYQGGESLKKNWHNLVEQIDAPRVRQVGSQMVQSELVYGGTIPEATIQQVAFLVSQDDQEGTLQLPGGAVPQDALPETGLLQEIPAGQRGIKNKVKIIRDPLTGAIQLIGDPEDIKIISDMIDKISKDSEGAEQTVKSIPLKNLQSEAVAEQIQNLYDGSSYASDYGSVQVQPLTSPNSLIVLGQQDAIDAVQKIVDSMDKDAPPNEMGIFKTFKLKFISAADAASRLSQFFGQLNTGAGENSLPDAPVAVIPDFRSNSVVVKGSAQFIQQAEQLLRTLDVVDGPAVNEVKIIRLRNTTASDMAVVIQDAINGQQQNSGLGANPGAQNQQQTQQQNQNNTNQSTLRSAILTLKSINQSGEYTSGIMFDVRVTADANSNSLVVTGPRESMPLIEALVSQLDQLPNAETQIKVFEIVNGDAETLYGMLETLFGASQNQGNQGNQGGTNLTQLPLQGASSSDGQTLVNLRFSYDLRSNTIIASGPAGDLQVVEDLLNRLDAQMENELAAQVYRLSNAPARDVEEAINSWLDGITAVVDNDPRLSNARTNADRQVIVVSEVVSNSLIVSARAEFRDEIEEIIRALDRRPPMVKVEVLIAEVDLNALEEFGVQLGVQDSLLFDRGTSITAGGNIVDGGIGFPFNNASEANLNAISPGNLAGQALSNLGLGRINNSVGYGGLVLSAGNESVNILMRALKDKQCVRTLSRPHIMTLENLEGRVSIGAEVPRVSSTTPNGFTVTQNVDFIDVGVILSVTPRVSPDGMIIMAVDAKKSAVGSDDSGITIGFGANGDPIRSPQIIETEANTTLMARSGQTVVFSGLIQETKQHTERGAPIISDLPVIGPLFKFESDQSQRTELLIIMTPHLITDDESLNNQNYNEFDRMHWCECDIAEIYGSMNYDGHTSTDSAVETFYPDMDPTGSQPVMPEQMPNLQEVIDVPQPGFEAALPQSSVERQKGGVRRASYTPRQRRR